jgi:hypothetical protein
MLRCHYRRKIQCLSQSSHFLISINSFVSNSFPIAFRGVTPACAAICASRIITLKFDFAQKQLAVRCADAGNRLQQLALLFQMRMISMCCLICRSSSLISSLSSSIIRSMLGLTSLAAFASRFSSACSISSKLQFSAPMLAECLTSALGGSHCPAFASGKTKQSAEHRAGRFYCAANSIEHSL